MHTADMFERHQIMNRTNFKKANVFSAYANALFNGGVFIHPAEEQC
jgi:Tfp pilus assembly protein PilZ